MLRRGTKRRNIDDEPPAAGQNEAPSVSSSQKERRQKTAPEVVVAVPAKSATVLPSATDATGSGGTIQPTPLTEEGPREGRFSPSFVHGGSRVLMLEDSVKAEPDLASTLLYGLALPKDMEQLPKEAMPSFKEMCSYLVQAGQAALNTSASLTQMGAERARYHDEVKEGRAKIKAFEKQQARDRNKIQQLQNDLLISNSKVGLYQVKMKEMEEAEVKKLAEADAKAFQEGMDKAATQYERDARRMVNRHLEKRLGPCWTEGFKAGVAAHAGKFQADVNDETVNGLLPEVLPEFELPYTAEQTAPLPSDDEAEEGEGEAADGREQIIDIDDAAVAEEEIPNKQADEVIGAEFAGEENIE